MIPVLEYRVQGDTLSYRWSNVIAGFDMPVDVQLGGDSYTRLHPIEQWQSAPATLSAGAELNVAPAFYVTTSLVK